MPISQRPIHHLYIHIPFCAKVCPYCAFYVHRGGVSHQEAFVGALIQEIEYTSTQYELGGLETLYFGGGTPSILSAKLFKRMGDALAKALSLTSDVEVTLEVNPATVTPAKARAWYDSGVNRISLGAQSFQSQELKLLGRQHTPEAIAETVSLLRDFSFPAINVDLIYAFPYQSEAAWSQNLQAALACEPDHLSAYALTYEPDTPFGKKLAKGEWPRQVEAREIAMFEYTVDFLEAQGLLAYEISNFARPGQESRHNQAYWQGKDYLGLGPSAWSTIGDRRWKNATPTERYIQLIAEQDFVALRQEEEELSPELKRSERLMLGLRTREGVSQEEMAFYKPLCQQLQEEGFLLGQKGRFCLSRQGRLVADSIAELFL